MIDAFKPTTLKALPGRGDTVYIDSADDHGNKIEHIDNGRLAMDPDESGDIYIAAEMASRAGNHPVHSIVKVSVSTRDGTRFLLETAHGHKYILRGQGRENQHDPS